MRQVNLLLIVYFVLLTDFLFAQNFWQHSDFPVFFDGGIMAIDANDNLVLAASYPNKVALSTDYGESWLTVGSFQYVASVCISNTGYLFAIAHNESLLYRSVDNGSTWVPYSNLTTYPDRITCSKASGFIYLGASDGVYRSTNNGDTWTKQNNGLTIGINSSAKLAVSHDKNTGKDLLIAATNTGLYKSDNNAETWTKIRSLSADYIAINSLGYVYANMYSVEPYFYSDSLFRSTDNGITWQPTISTYNYFFVNPEDDIISYFYWDSYSYSTDYGTSWNNIPINPISPRCMTSNGKGTYFIAINDLGILKSHSLTEYSWETSNSGFPGAISAVSSILFKDETIFAGTKSFGLNKSTDNGDTFSKVPSVATGFSITSLKSSENYIFGLFTFGINRSSDNGDTWVTYNYNIGEPLYNFYAYSLCAENGNIIIGGHTIAGSEAQIWRSTNYGNNWTNVFSLSSNNSAALPSNKIITIASNNTGVSLSVQQRAEDLHTHFGSYKYVYDIYRSTDYGVTWNITDPGIPELPLIIDFVWNSKNQIIALTTQGLIQSNDEGKTWFYPSGSVPTLNINSIIVDLNDNLYIGTGNKGIFISRDNGFSWEPMNEGLTDTTVNVLKLRSDGYIFAGTEHGGVYRRRLSTTSIGEVNITPSEFKLSQNFPNPFNPTTKIKYSIPSSSLVTIKIYDLLGRDIATLVNEEKPAGNYEAEFDGGGLASGTYFYEINTGNYSEVRKMIFLK